MVACSACKPGSVEARIDLPIPRQGDPVLGRSFLSERGRPRPQAAYPRLRAPRLLNAVGEVGHLSPPIWSCSDRGLPSHACCQACGGLLPHLFTLTSGLHRRRFVFCGTVRHESEDPCPGVTWRSARWSPDFPRRVPESTDRDRPADHATTCNLPGSALWSKWKASVRPTGTGP